MNHRLQQWSCPIQDRQFLPNESHVRCQGPKLSFHRPWRSASLETLRTIVGTLSPSSMAPTYSLRLYFLPGRCWVTWKTKWRHSNKVAHQGIGNFSTLRFTFRAPWKHYLHLRCPEKQYLSSSQARGLCYIEYKSIRFFYVLEKGRSAISKSGSSKKLHPKCAKYFADFLSSVWNLHEWR